MIKTGICLFFLIVITPLQSQTLKGIVYDRATDSTLCGVIVYVNGTSTGVVSDNQGTFKLPISRYRSMPVTFSLLGYYSFTLKEYDPTKNYHIYLTPKVSEIDEVVIKGKSLHWETYLRIFKREFLGESSNAMSCTIVNQRNLHFLFKADSSTLKAFSNEPLIIKNTALAYTITYYLDLFRYSKHMEANHMLVENFAIRGNYLFKDEIDSLPTQERLNVLEKRKNAYLGSCMHLFRVLSLGKNEQITPYKIKISDSYPISSGFLLHSEKPVNQVDLVMRQDSINAFLQNVGSLKIRCRLHYSEMLFLDESVHFQKNGYFNPDALEISGDLSKKRIGDLLPFEYQP